MKKLLLLFVLVASTVAVHAADLEWNFSTSSDITSKLTAGDTIKEDVTFDSLTIHATSSKYMRYTQGSATIDDVSYSYRLQTQGSGSTSDRYISINVAGSCQIYVAMKHASSSITDTRTMTFSTASGETLGTLSVDAETSSLGGTVSYTGGATTINLVTSGGINIFDIQLTYTTSDDVSSGATGDTLLVYAITAADTASSHFRAYLEAGPGTIYLGASTKQLEASTVAPSGYAYKLDGDNSSSNSKYALLTLADGVTFQAGDIISMQIFCTSAPSEEKPYGVGIYTELGGDSIAYYTLSAKNTLETFTYIVSDNDGIDGVSAIYVQRNSGWSTYFYSATIIRESTATTIERATIDNWATFSSSSNVSYDTESVKAYTATLVTDNDTTYIQLAQYDGDVLPAETGFVLYSTAETITLTPTTTEASSTVSDNDLIATCDTVFTVTESKKYYGLGSGATFYPIAVGGTAPANRAYLIIESDASAIAMSIIDSDAEEDVTDDTTGIGSVKSSATQQDGVYYNLQGMRVSEPASGIYIVNGKKVIIK